MNKNDLISMPLQTVVFRQLLRLTVIKRTNTEDLECKDSLVKEVVDSSSMQTNKQQKHKSFQDCEVLQLSSGSVQRPINNVN